MPIEYPLNFLRALERNSPPPVIAIAGPQAFLREYVLAAIRSRLARDGFQFRSFQLGGADRVETIVDELETSDLFAQKRLVGIRLLRSFRERPVDDEDGADGAAAKGSEAVLADALARISATLRVVVAVERDSVPAKIRRAVEARGAVVNCGRPFENQLGQYAELFARAAERRLSPTALDLLMTRYGSDLSALANAISLAALVSGNERIEADAFGDYGASSAPELFEIADALARGSFNETLALFTRALQIGRDPIELLALEVIPVLRRMMLAAALLDSRKNDAAIAGALGLPPQSAMAARAIEGARRFGLKRLREAHRRACTLDEQLKTGEIKQRDQAVGALLMDLLAAPRAA